MPVDTILTNAGRFCEEENESLNQTCVARDIDFFLLECPYL